VHSLDCCSEQKLSGCNSLLRGEIRAIGGQPVSSPQTITDAVLQLEALLSKLEPVVANAMKDINDKKLVNQGSRNFIFLVAFTISSSPTV